MIRESAPLLRVIFRRPVEKNAIVHSSVRPSEKASPPAQRQNRRRQQPYLFSKPLKQKTENALSTEQPPLHQIIFYIFYFKVCFQTAFITQQAV